MEKAEPEKDHRHLPPRVIAISSGKGGVGKSSISVNLAISLAKGGSRVCLLDADTGLANANILLGLTPQFSLEHVLYGAKPIEDVMLDGPHGLKIVPGAHGISECVTLHPRQQLRLTRELSRIESDFDYILIDTAAGISDTTLDFVSAAHHTLVVITPEPTSLTDAFSLIKLLKRRRKSVHYHVVVNMCSNGVQAKEVFHRFSSAVDKYIGVETHYLGCILRDESMRAAVVLQNPVAMFPDTDPSSRGFVKLADSLEAAANPDEDESSFSEYWQQQFRQRRDHPGEAVSAPVQPAPEPEPTQTRDSDYQAELRSRVLLLIEQGNSEPPQIAALLQEAVETFIKRYEYSPLDILGQVEALVQSPDRDDQLMRGIADLVKPWVGFSPPPPVGDISDPDINLVAEDPDGERFTEVGEVQIYDHSSADPGPGAQQDSEGEPSGDSRIDKLRDQYTAARTAALLASECLHHYDARRFGSQENLLDLLKRSESGEQTLAEFLDNLV